MNPTTRTYPRTMRAAFRDPREFNPFEGPPQRRIGCRWLVWGASLAFLVLTLWAQTL
jgi:hypothetical protein